MNQRKKLYSTFFKRKASEWLKQDYLDLTSEEERCLLFPETKQLPMEILQGINAVFYEIYAQLSDFDTALSYFKEDCYLRDNSLEYLLYSHNFYSTESKKSVKRLSRS